MTRMRSPNYPAIPLAQAIGLTEKIFREDRTNLIEREVAAQHMGYSGLTGRTLKLLGALSQFGLLEKSGKGKVRISKTAVSILHGIDDAERQGAITKAGRAPALFRRIAESFDAPSEKTITSFLMQQGFTDAAIGPVLRSYNETNSFLAANGASESYGKGGENGAESPADDDFAEDDDDMEPELPPAGEQDQTPKRRGLRFLDTGPLDFQLSTTGLVLSGTTNSAQELTAFVEKLKALAQLLPEDNGTEH